MVRESKAAEDSSTLLTRELSSESAISQVSSRPYSLSPLLKEKVCSSFCPSSLNVAVTRTVSSSLSTSGSSTSIAVMREVAAPRASSVRSRRLLSGTPGSTILPASRAWPSAMRRR